MAGRRGVGFVVALFVGGLALSTGFQASAQMGPGMMGGSPAPSSMPMQQMSDVVKQMADRLASRKGLDAEKAEPLRRLAERLLVATGRMAGGTGGGVMGGGMMGGGMMGQGSEQMAEISQILTQMRDLLRGQ